MQIGLLDSKIIVLLGNKNHYKSRVKKIFNFYLFAFILFINISQIYFYFVYKI
jgi:hypothetical protein